MVTDAGRKIQVVRAVEESQVEVSLQKRQRWDADDDEMGAWESTVRSKVFLVGLGATGFVGLLLLALFKRKS